LAKLFKNRGFPRFAQSGGIHSADSAPEFSSSRRNLGVLTNSRSVYLSLRKLIDPSASMRARVNVGRQTIDLLRRKLSATIREGPVALLNLVV
jgi:hypothetical protein